jgi:hypothetical protein
MPPIHLLAKPLAVQLPWQRTQQSIMLEVIRQYRETYVEALPPTHKDLIEWLYNRSLDAENTVKLLEREVVLYDSKIKDLNAEIAILEAGKRGI